MTQPTDRTSSDGLLAIDVGTSRAKFGWFAPPARCTSETVPNQLPVAAPRLRLPDDTFCCQHRGAPVADFAQQVTEWLHAISANAPQVVLASVNAEGSAAVAVALEEIAFSARVLVGSELPIAMEVDEPARVGIDRLLNAVAVNRLREANSPAIIVDMGTATTVDLVDARGAFQGGAILPGLALAASSLHTGTTSLPSISPSDLVRCQTGVGKSTQQAISSGLYWGLVGAVCELVERMTASCPHAPQLFLTGGDASQFADELAARLGSFRHVPHLVLAGIAASCEEVE